MSQKFIITGFADEISSNVDVQFAHLNKLGISYFEPRGIEGRDFADLTLDEVAALKKKMDAAGIRASSIGSPIGKIKITDPMAPHLEKLAHVIQIAKMLETNYIRVFSFYIPDGDDPKAWRDEVMNRMRQMAELAEREGVMLLHENERKIYGETADRCLDILETVNSPALGCVYDPANFAFCGHISYPDSFRLLRDKITYFHMKDAILNGEVTPVGEGDGGVAEVLSQAVPRETPYFLSLEPHLGRFTGLDKLEADGRLDYLPDGGPDVFGVAYRALVKLLGEIGAEFE